MEQEREAPVDELEAVEEGEEEQQLGDASRCSPVNGGGGSI
jgi:hypothetical protein